MDASVCCPLQCAGSARLARQAQRMCERWKGNSMAEVKDIVLAPITPVAGDKLKVDLTYKLVFNASETGKKFKVTINLYGEDLTGDNEPAGLDLQGPKALYTFGFGTAPLIKKYKLITAQAGEHSVTEPSREVDKTLLNEDPGFTQKIVAGQVVTVQHPDEIYAVVSVSSEAHSNTIQIMAVPT